MLIAIRTVANNSTTTARCLIWMLDRYRIAATLHQGAYPPYEGLTIRHVLVPESGTLTAMKKQYFKW